MEEKKFYEEIIAKLEKLYKKEYAFIASIGLQASLLITIAAVTSLALLESIFHFSSLFRTVAVLLFILFFFAGLILFVLLPILKYFNVFRKPDYYSAAAKVGDNFPAVKDNLLNAMQLVANDKKQEAYSTELINAAFKNVYMRAKDIRFESIVSFKKSKELLIYFTLVVIACAASFGFSNNLRLAGNRLLNFNKEFKSPSKFSFEIYPGNAQLTKGDDLTISVKVNGAVPARLKIATKSQEETESKYETLAADSSGKYFYTVSGVRNSFEYFVVAEDVTSELYKVTVIEKPVISSIEVVVKPPSYSNLPEIRQKDNANITSLRGSRVTLSAQSTKKMSSGKVVFGDSTETDFKVDNNFGETNFIIKKDNTFKIIVADEKENKNDSPILYSIKALDDAYPAIEVINPGKNVNLDNDNRLALLAKINDDYGFSRLLLKYRLSTSRYEKPSDEFKEFEISVSKKTKEENVNYIWNLTSLSLAVDDIVTYYLEIFDNDTFDGPKSARSDIYTVRVPSLDEILARADETHTEANTDLKEILKEAADLKKNLEKIDQTLKQDKKDITWEEKQQIEDALDKFEKLQQKAEETGQKLQQMQNELQKNNLLSKETLEKYADLQKLFDELSSDEMKKAMEKMQKTLESLNRQNTQNQMQDLKLDEEKFKQSIERTIELLKRVQVEQKINEMLKRTEKMTQKQDDIKKETEQSDLNKQNENEQLQKQQDQVSQDLKKFQDEMKKLEEMMKDLEQMPKEDLKKLQEEFEKQKNQEKSDQASENLQNKQKQQAMEQMQQLSKNMKQMQSRMQQMQQNMMQQNQMQAFKDMMKVLDNLLTLSKQQEELKKQSEQLDPNSPQFNEQAEQQNNIQRSLDNILKQMSQLSKKTFSITPEMGKALGDAKKEMQNSLQAMQNRNGSMASMSQGEAMKSLNEAASLVKGGMESMMSGSGQGGMMSMMQQLGQMSQQQMNLNNMTQMLQKMQQGGMSLQDQAQMQRLSQQQELIRKSLEQLNKEAQQSGKSKTLPGNLEEIMKQMSEVITDFNTQKLDDPLIQKQEKILSRMLDAQRSINERDFEKQRESNTGRNIVGESPAELDMSSQKGFNKIREELNKAVNEGYLKDYEQLIRRYYELLEK
ncbi:MAG: hypothetical protein K8H86_02825 [Ignavibacteriaceae bacterium]|nr:hypothetical protein [Ignavibacteriaceae bacterium]